MCVWRRTVYEVCHVRGGEGNGEKEREKDAISVLSNMACLCWAFCSSFLDLENTPQGKAAHDDNNNKHQKKRQERKRSSNNNNNNNNNNQKKIYDTKEDWTRSLRGVWSRGRHGNCVDLHAHTRPSDRHFPVPLLFQPATEVLLPYDK